MLRNFSSVDLYYFDCSVLHNSFTCTFVFFAWRFIPFILFIIGFFGNILNFIVLSRPRIRTYSTTTYLLFLAGSDLVFQISVVLNDTLYSIIGTKIADFSAVYCKLYRWLRYTCAAFSVWLLVLMTIERMVVVKAPLFARSKLSPKTSTIASLITLAVVSLCNIHLIPGSSYVRKASSRGECTHSSEEYSNFINGIWNILVLTFYTVIPAVLIFVGNANIAIVLLLKRKSFSRVHPSSASTLAPCLANGSNNIRSHNDARIQMISTVNRDRHTSVRIEESPREEDATSSPPVSRNRPKNSRERSSTRLLFTISVFFLMTTLPYCIYAIFRGQLQEIDDNGLAIWRALTFIISMLLWSNFSFNFLLYFVSGSLFKQEWKILIEKIKSRLNQR